ncbi:reverse transcriptase domain-containing protein [Mesorhizobium sp. ANAO-SY3R2]|uniref:reverse transcriptase domain-containing protein n=1 Tax=Mesorhizobium sp. ANAO-SY3R2 TaxID=3166644 RepID=UPI00366DCB3C
MATHNYEYRYELKPDRFVYIQTKNSAIRGKAIIKQVLKKYNPHQIFYHLERRGGHVAALRLHQKSKYFSRFDITNFFGQVSRTRVARSLRSVGFKAPRAFNIAMESVVVEGNAGKVLPYGFCQSPVLATLSLEQSHLGSELKRLNGAGFLVSVYMDDILISAEHKDVLEEASEAIMQSANIALFPLSPNKIAIATAGVDTFNCHIEANTITILDERMESFILQHGLTTDDGKQAIEKYIGAVSIDELDRFLKMM